jgi:hypothetical protein
MMRRHPYRGFGAAVLAAIPLAASACAPSAITRARVEHAVAPTFTSLVQVQLDRMGLGPVPPPGIKAVANCRRLTGAADRGAGEWTCAITWYGPNGTGMLDTYDVNVGTDGCYTASVAGEEGHLGGPTIVATDGRSVRNLLYVFEGCFDTSS